MKSIIGRIVLISPIVEIKRRESSLLMSDKSSAKLVYQEGRVYKIGSGVPDGLIAEGDRVLYNRVSGHDLVVNGDTFRVVPVKDGDSIFILDEEDTIL